MNFVVDENVSSAVVPYLRLLGHEVMAIGETATTGVPDSSVFDLVKQKQAVLVTRDRDFTDSLSSRRNRRNHLHSSWQLEFGTRSPNHWGFSFNS